MEINRQNYESYFIDFLDGKLNEEQVGILLSFLEFNPDLKEEFADIEKMCLEPEAETFSGKENLLKSDSDLKEVTIMKDFDMYCISSMENDIAEEDENVLQGIISDDPDRADTYRLYQSARLLPDKNILYPGKTRLKRRYIGIPYRIVIPTAAAVAVLILLLQVIISRPPDLAPSALTNQGNEPVDEMERQNPPVTVISPNPVETTEPSPEENTRGSDRIEDTKIPRYLALGTDKTPRKDGSNPPMETIPLVRIKSKSIPRVTKSKEGSDEITSPYLSLRPAANQLEGENPAEGAENNPRLSLWILADAGIKGLNSVSEDEYHLDRKKDKNGKTRRITFDTPVFGISAPLRKSDKQR